MAKLTDRLNSMIGGTERGLQEVGRNIRKNVDQGQKDLKSGKNAEYAAINPLKGTRTAFKKGYKAQ